MRILEPHAAVQVFASSAELRDYLAANPRVRNAGRCIRQTTLPGEVCHVIVTHATPQEAAEADRLALVQAQKDRQQYLAAAVRAQDARKRLQRRHALTDYLNQSL